VIDPGVDDSAEVANATVAVDITRLDATTRTKYRRRAIRVLSAARFASRVGPIG
jgi:hypothetical protein